MSQDLATLMKMQPRLPAGPVSVLTFDTFQKRREGHEERPKLGKQKAEMGPQDYGP